MAEIPKLVRERLKVASPLGNHPDADLLTAYSEQALPERERTVVLNHLSRCAECREIVALALPDAADVQAVHAHSGSRLGWPAFRWAFATAGLFAVALFGVVQYRHYNRPSMAVKNAPAPMLQAKTEAPPQAAGKGVQKQQVSRQDSETPAVLDNGASAEAPRFEAREQTRGNHRSSSRDARPHGPMQPEQWQQRNAFAFRRSPASPSAPVPSAGAADRLSKPTQTVSVAAESPAITVTGQDLNTLAVQHRSFEPLAGNSDKAEAEVEKAKPALSATPPKILAPADSIGGQVRSKPLTANALRWTINSSGGLQRSFDQGITWEDVNVTDAALGSGAPMQFAAAPAAKTAGSLKEAKKDQTLTPVFRTVAANGADVWAGGANGLLYHSIDAGAHWTHVVPVFSGAVLAGDILTIEFSDSQHGRIVTSVGETWLTGDRGMTWQKQ